MTTLTIGQAPVAVVTTEHPIMTRLTESVRAGEITSLSSPLQSRPLTQRRAAIVLSHLTYWTVTQYKGTPVIRCSVNGTCKGAVLVPFRDLSDTDRRWAIRTMPGGGRAKLLEILDPASDKDAIVDTMNEMIRSKHE